MKGDDSHLKNKCIHSGNYLSKETEIFFFSTLFSFLTGDNTLTMLCWSLPYNTRSAVSVYISPSSWACSLNYLFLKCFMKGGVLQLILWSVLSDEDLNLHTHSFVTRSLRSDAVYGTCSHYGFHSGICIFLYSFLIDGTTYKL